MTILERLKTETKAHHDQIEEVGFSSRIMNGSLNKEQYTAMVINNYIMHYYLENIFDNLSEFNTIEGLEYPKRKKTDLIAKDLIALGLDPKDYQNTPLFNLPINDKYQALGAFYVLEGSTLGGAVIARTLKKNENLTDIDTYHFYGCYGEEVGMRWKQFCQVLLNEGQETENQDKMVKSASDTFDAMSSLFMALNSN